jgi:ferrochelatase
VADEIGLPFARAATVGTDAQFVGALVDLLVERAAQARGEEPQRPTLGSRPPVRSTCPVGCCRNLRAERPAACGADWKSPVVAGR